MFRRLRRTLSGIVTGISNILVYAPLLYRDRDWDHAYLYDLMAVKMRRMARHHERYGLVKSSSKIARELRVCAELLDRIEGRIDPMLPFERAHTEKWGELTFEGGGLFTRLKREKVFTKADEEAERKESRRLWDHEEAIKRRALELFGKIFVRKSQTWWD